MAQSLGEIVIIFAILAPLRTGESKDLLKTDSYKHNDRIIHRICNSNWMYPNNALGVITIFLSCQTDETFFCNWAKACLFGQD